MVIVFIYSKNNDLNFLGQLAVTTSIISHIFAREQSHILIQFINIDIIDDKKTQ